MTVGVPTTAATVHEAVYRTDRHASVNLCLSQPAWTTTTKTRELNRIYLYAAANLKRKYIITDDCARSILLFKLTTDRHEAYVARPLCDSRATCRYCRSHRTCWVSDAYIRSLCVVVTEMFVCWQWKIQTCWVLSLVYIDAGVPSRALWRMCTALIMRI